MNSKLINIIVFATGAALGYGVAWKTLSMKYENKAQEEIDSVRQMYKGDSKIYPETEKSFVIPNEKESMEMTKEIMKNQGYKNYSECSREEPSPKIAEDDEEEPSIYSVRPGDLDRPYVISPDEFGEMHDYEQISLLYYSDDILADDQGDLIDDIDNCIGLDNLNSFGTYEDDSVFVRNDKLRCEYEILKDIRRWAEVNRKPGLTNNKPHQMED